MSIASDIRERFNYLGGALASGPDRERVKPEMWERPKVQEYLGLDDAGFDTAQKYKFPAAMHRAGLSGRGVTLVWQSDVIVKWAEELKADMRTLGLLR